MIFVLGGTRSGKSRYGVARAREAAGDAVTFIATARPGDEELEARIALHRRSRPESWPVRLADADLAREIRGADPHHALLIDSLTLWVSTVLERGQNVGSEWQAAADALRARGGTVVIVSDEIGLGMVPLDSLSRRFRDELGWLHQQVATAADEVWLMVAGLPLRVKGAPS